MSITAERAEEVDGVDEILTLLETAAELKLERKTVMNLIGNGELRASRVGPRGLYRVRRSDIYRYLDQTASTSA